jgi:hypothetical protein
MSTDEPGRDDEQQGDDAEEMQDLGIGDEAADDGRGGATKPKGGSGGGAGSSGTITSG